MELFQISWGEEKKLFLEFKKDESESQTLLPEKIRRLNLKFQISKTTKQKTYTNQPPYLISIKKLYYSNEYLCFSIDLDEIYSYNDIQIRIVRLTVLLYSGQRIEYTFKEKFDISDIWVNEDCYSGFNFINLRDKNVSHKTITTEKLIKTVKTDYHTKKQESTVIYEKNCIKDISANETLISIISENNKTLKNIENQLINLNQTIQNMPLTNLSYNATPPLLNKRNQTGIERIKIPTKPALINGQMSSSKLMVIKEMKTIFNQNKENNSIFNIKDILKPLTDVELQEMILDDEMLIQKEEEAITNQIKRLQKHLKQEILLENLTGPR
ncbi:hypothetical protein LCGC14_0899260 [marine sediment metagenome]|uniref:Uncharacterized protein n=1 Tax=marine sediment metagenome TaxID=412755 RepID=A0A0F9P1R3_9ZZZZ